MQKALVTEVKLKYNGCQNCSKKGVVLAMILSSGVILSTFGVVLSSLLIYSKRLSYGSKTEV